MAETLSLSDPESPQKAMNVAWLKYQAGEYTEAQQWLNRVKSDTAAFHYLQAQCYGRLGENELMKSALHLALELDESLKMKALDDPAFSQIFG